MDGQGERQLLNGAILHLWDSEFNPYPAPEGFSEPKGCMVTVSNVYLHTAKLEKYTLTISGYDEKFYILDFGDMDKVAPFPTKPLYGYWLVLSPYNEDKEVIYGCMVCKPANKVMTR